MFGGLRLIGRVAGSLVGLSLARGGTTPEASAQATVIPFPIPRRKPARHPEEDCD
jgi:hypothetical protein